MTHGNGATLFITDDGMTISLFDTRGPSPEAARTGAVTIRGAGSSPSVPVGESLLESKSNFFLGNDPSKWRTNVANFAAVRARAWLPGVDLVWHGGAGGLEYDLEVAAGTDASLVAFDVEGATALSVAGDGSLAIDTPAGTLVQRPPSVIQSGRTLPARYRIDGTHRVGFQIDGYELGRPVLIDPTVSFSTYVGGTADEGYNVGADITVDGAGGIYFAGDTVSTNFPVANAAQPSKAGGSDSFIIKLSAAGTVFYSTYLGGAGAEYSLGIGVDGSGDVYVGGFTNSNDFPTVSAAQSAYGGGTGDGFVAKIGANGSSLLYSTYLGGNAADAVHDVAADASGGAYLTGIAESTDFPTVNAIKPSPGGIEAFVTKLNTNGSFAYSTYLGGSLGDVGGGIAVDGSGNAYVSGETASFDFPTVNAAQKKIAGSSDRFVTKLNPSGSAFIYSTYIGGAGSDYGGKIALDGNGNAWIAGSTTSFDYPKVNDIQGYYGGNEDACVTKLNAAGNTFLFSTYLGGIDADRAYDIAVDGSGNAYVTGYTQLGTFPILNSMQSYAGAQDAFVAKFSAAGSPMVYATYLGGSGGEYPYGIAADAAGNAYVAGYTFSTDFPMVAPIQASLAGGRDGFVAKIGDGPVALGLAPNLALVAPKGSKTFVAFGGSGTGYAFSFATNASGGTIQPITGAYVAGATPNVTDVLRVTDSANAVATATVTVGAGVSVSPASPTTAPKGTVNLVASGGSGTGFTWSLPTNASGGSINGSTGVYVAGTIGSVTDIVHVADSLGNAADINVAVSAGVTLLPASPSCAPKASISFTASGGSGLGFAWSLPVNGSGATLNASTGAYVAGTTGSVIDLVRVTDSLGNVADTTVTVGPSLVVTPSSPSTTPKGTISFTASGGSGAGQAWSLSTNASGGTIHATSGKYFAGSTGSVTDTVTVTDSLGNVGSTGVAVGPGIVVSPNTPSTPPKGAISLSATGGSGTGYVWSLTSNASGGMIQAATGLYTAGATGGVSDTVTVTDSLGNAATVAVVVGANIIISPNAPTVPPRTALTFSATGGSGTGYLWSIATNASGATISSGGTYVAGMNAGVDTVRLVDSLGNTATTAVTVSSEHSDAGVPDGGAGAAPPADGCGCRIAKEAPASSGLPSVLALIAFALRRRKNSTLIPGARSPTRCQSRA